MTRYPPLVATSLLVGLAVGCTALLDFPEEVTGYRWCLDAEPATGRRFDNQILTEIRYPVSNNWTRACTCFCAADHQLMLQGAAGELTPGSEDALWYELQLGQLRASAATACDDRTAELATEHATLITFDDPQTVSCLDAVADESAYFAEECTQYDDLCPPGSPGGFGTDGYIPGESSTASTEGSDTGIDASGTGRDTAVDSGSSDGSDGSDSGTTGGAGLHGLDDWSSAIDCPTRDHCDIDAAFVRAVLTDPRVLSQEHIRVEAGLSALGHRGVHVIELAPDSLPAALGLQAGDVLWRVDEIELRTGTDVVRALERLTRAVALTAVIDRRESTFERTYRIVER